MRDTQACRACLNTESRLERIPDSWYRLFEFLIGIKISKNDGYPNYLCVECKGYMHKAIAFRKKSRRAFFILKEIMLVKKEVTLEDILTVNRNATNLKSGIGIWQPEKHFRLIKSEEGQDILEKHKTKIINQSVILNVQEIEIPEEEFTETNAISLNDDDIQNVDDQEDEADIASDIDMEDVFKGLKEPDSEVSDEEEGETEKEQETIIKKKSCEDIELAKALTLFDVEFLNVEQQKEAYKSMKESPKYKSAVYKCDSCVEAMTSYEELYVHYNDHLRTKNSTFKCEICLNRFANEDALRFHMSERHLYKLTCKVCKETISKLSNLTMHCLKHDGYVTKYYRDLVSEVYEKFLMIPIAEEDKKETFKKLSVSGPHKCDECDTSFALKYQLGVHKDQHKISIGTACSICSVKFKHNAMKTHMETCHNYIYHCKECSYEAQNRLLAEHHVLNDHKNKESSYQCKFCDWKTKSMYIHQRHLQSKHWSKINCHHCISCGRGFIDVANLYAHQFNEHGILYPPEVPTEGAPNSCGHCNVQFMSEKAYSNHLVHANHEEANLLPWKCLPCKKLFDSEEQYKEHMLRCEMIYFPRPCQLCGATVETRKHFAKHCKAHHPNYTCRLDKRRLCDSCGNTYKHRCSCKDLEKKKKLSNVEYKCSICDIEFKKALEVIRHVVMVHVNEPYSCNVCSMKFKWRHNCKDHILKVHAPVKPFGCPICQKEFSHIDFVKKHSKKMHDIKVNLAPKKKDHKRKFFLYPNMKIDLSLIDSRIIKKAKILVADYTDQVFEVIQDYTDYVIFNDNDE